MEGIIYDDDSQENNEEAFTVGQHSSSATYDPLRTERPTKARPDPIGRSHIGPSMKTPDRVKRSGHTVRGGHVTKQTPKSSALSREKAKREKLLAKMNGYFESALDDTGRVEREEEIITSSIAIADLNGSPSDTPEIGGKLPIRERASTVKGGGKAERTRKPALEVSEIDDDSEETFDLSFGNIPHRNKQTEYHLS
ncbi:hypothetical protein VTL71DRAFT_3721 [Oculimacula yallundae]|uniref:Uncharacterized protein n=1 Tax=Oculimacula yallundae TaxID=86028 RepID=A0ABR4C3U6_9HELO